MNLTNLVLLRQSNWKTKYKYQIVRSSLKSTLNKLLLNPVNIVKLFSSPSFCLVPDECYFRINALYANIYKCSTEITKKFT